MPTKSPRTVRVDHPSATANRTRANLTIPTWLFEKASYRGARRGYGMSELVSRLLEKFVEQEERTDSTPSA